MECMHALRCSAFALIIAGLGAGPTAIARPAQAMIESDPALDLLLTREAQRILDAHQVRTSRSPHVVVNASVDLERQRLIIRFGPGMLPAEDDHSLEEIEQYIRSSLETYAMKSGVGEVQSEVLYEGKPYWEHFPIMTSARSQSSDASMVNSVLVSASHGLVRVHPGLEWEFQRPAMNGVQEDLITPGYAEELQQLMEERGGQLVHRARRNQGDLHPESGRAWSEMSSRYHLRDLLPDRPDIWNHFANSTATDREVSDDIRGPHRCTGREAQSDHHEVRERWQRPLVLEHTGGRCRWGEIAAGQAQGAVHTATGWVERYGGRVGWSLKAKRPAPSRRPFV